MQFEQSRSDIESFLNDNWSYTDIQFDNVSFNPGDEYIRPTIFDGESSKISLGTYGAHRRVGVLIVQIFVKKNTGTSRSKVLADYLSGLFKDLKLSDIQFESPTLIRVGQTEGYHQENFQIPYYIDIC